MKREPTTAALLVALRSPGFAVGDGEAPRPLPDDELPYAILEEEPGGALWGPALTAPTSCASWVYTVRCVGRSRKQVRMLSDALDGVVLGRSASGAFTTAITPAGMVVGDRFPDAEGGMDREGDVFNATRRYVLQVVPA